MSNYIDSDKNNLSVLIVDNNPDFRKSMIKTLAQLASDVSIRECANASEAYAALAAEEFDVALITQELPDQLATDLLVKLKENGWLNTPIILLTDTDDVGEEVIRLGAHEFLSKQARNVQQLRKSVRYSLERHRLWRELQNSKEREQREHELRLLEQAETGSSAIQFDQKTFDRQLNKLMEEYKHLFSVFSADASYKRTPQAPHQIRTFAAKLGKLGCGPKEIVQIHRKVLSNLIENKTSKRQESLTNESRYLLLQLMGELILYYRERSNP